jgi:invasion protein IalB
MRNFLYGILSIYFAMLATTSARAQDSNLIDVFGDWNAFALKQRSGPVCYIGSVPIKSSGKYSKRGDVLFLVTHRPAAKANDVVNFQTGYTFKTGIDVQLIIGKATYKLFTEGEDAWAFDAKSDKAIINSLIMGAQMTVKGTSSRGTKTKDIFSLKGFSAAYKAASKACKF